ncbi:MAG: LysR family transcriptional regulator [Pseudomonadota bacterium]
MRVVDIRTFVTLVRTRHFGETAVRLNVSQPAVSARIAAVEGALGHRLVERGGGFALTAAGEQALATFEEMLATFDGLSRNLSGTDPPRVVRIGAIDSVAATFLPHMIDAVHQRMPAVMIEVSVEGTKPLLEGLERGAYDIVFAVDPALGEHVRSFLTCMIDMVWAGSPMRVDAAHTYSVDELARLPIITFPRDTPPYRQIAPYFADERVLAEKLTSSNSLFAIIALLVAGFGVGAVPLVTIGEELGSGRLIKVDAAKPFPPLPIIASYQSARHDGVMTLLAEQARCSAAAFADKLASRSLWVP